MNGEFVSILPLSAEDLRQHNTISAGDFITWGSAAAGVYNYWNLRGVSVDLFLQRAFSSSSIGAFEEDYKVFSYSGAAEGCVCAMEPYQRITRGSKPFLRSACPFGTFTLDGPFFMEGTPEDADFKDVQIAFRVGAQFSWNGFTLKKQTDDEENAVLSVDLGIMGTSVPMCITAPTTPRDEGELFYGSGSIVFY